MSALRFTRVSYWYPKAHDAALRDVTLAHDAGMLLVTGDSGSGKSTLLRLCNGLIPHFHGGSIRGALRVYEHDVLRTPTRQLARDVGFVFQDPELQAVYATVERDVAFGLENLAVPRRMMVQHVSDALERTGIPHLRGRAVSTLSGGERQRLALAGVLALRPRILVLDEPLSQLDDDGATQLIGTLRTLLFGGTVVVISEHRVERVTQLATRSLRLEAGSPRESRVAPAISGDGAGTVDAAPCVRSEWALRSLTAGFAAMPVLHDVNLEGSGDVVALVGPNGSGKTTLLRTLAGLQPALAGTVMRSPGRVAYLPQNPTALLHRPTVRDELRWTVRHEHHGDDAVTQALELFGLRHAAGRYPRDLSTGERQRAALAAVLVGAPATVLLDEPTRGMDARARAALCAAVVQLRRQGCSVLLATHDEELVRRTADRVVVLGGATARLQQPPARVAS